MSVTKYIKVFQVIKKPETIGNLIRVLNKLHKEKRFRSGAIMADQGKNQVVDKDIRNVEILPLSSKSDSLTEVHWCNYIIYLIKDAMSKYHQEFPDVPPVQINEVQALRYEKTGHYGFHIDDGPGTFRRLSAILILNNDYEGGNLQFKIDKEILTIPNKPGNLVIWPSNFIFPHGVTPITKGVRYSIVAWMV
tara:strand:- start:2011 stop:2586 length:576 start_codon:yes stop_codon:yes gene_type:complete